MKKPYFNYIDRGMIKAGNKYMIDRYNLAKTKKVLGKEVIKVLMIKQIIKFLSKIK